MKVIWKYAVKMQDEQEIEMPKNAKMLTVQVQNDVPCIWALVDPNETKELVKFRIVGTGNEFEDAMVMDSRYIGTFQLPLHSLVFHLFLIY